MQSELNKPLYHSKRVHVHGDGGRPLCRQTGPDLVVVDAETFRAVSTMQQCRRCARALGLERYLGELRVQLSGKLRQLIKAIRERTPAQDDWIPAAELCENKTSSGRSSLHRSLRRLQARGYIEKKTEKAKAYVKLKKS